MENKKNFKIWNTKKYIVEEIIPYHNKYNINKITKDNEDKYIESFKNDTRCEVCGRKLNNEFVFVGMSETDDKIYSNEKEATQGFFPVGKTCFDKLLKQGYWFQTDDYENNIRRK